MLGKFYNFNAVEPQEVNALVMGHHVNSEDLKQICHMTSNFLTKCDEVLVCYTLLIVTLIVVGRRAAMHGVMQSSDYKNLLRQAADFSHSFSPGFEKDMFGSDPSCPTATTEKLRAFFNNEEDQLLRVVTSLLGQCNERIIHLSAMLMATDLWLGILLKWRDINRWVRYLSTVSWKSTEARYLVISTLASFQTQSYFSVDLDASALLLCVGQLYAVYPMDEQSVGIIWDILVMLRFHTSKDNVRCFLQYIGGRNSAPPVKRRLIVYVLGKAASTVDQDMVKEFFRYMHLGHDFDQALSSAKQAGQKIGSSHRHSACLCISDGLADFCIEEGFRPSVLQLTAAVSQRGPNCEIAINACGKLAIAYLTGDTRFQVKEANQSDQRISQIVRLISAVKTYCSDSILALELCSILSTIHNKLGCNVIKTAQLIATNDVLREISDFAITESQFDRSSLSRFRFAPRLSMQELLRDTVEVFSIFSRRHITIGVDVACTILWAAYCVAFSEELPNHIPESGSRVESMNAIVSIPSKIRSLNTDVMAAILYSNTFHAIGVFQPVWSVRGVSPMVRVCSQVYTTHGQQHSWLKSLLSGYASMCTELELLQIRLTEKKFTRGEYAEFAESLPTLNDLFVTVHLSRVDRLPNPDTIIKRMKKILLLLDWLASRSVSSATGVLEELESLSNSVDATVFLMEERLNCIWDKFGEPLKEQLASNCKESMVHFILHFAGRSQLFDVETRSDYNSSESAEDTQWTRRIKRLLKKAHVRFTELLNGAVEYRYIKPTLESLTSVDLPGELEVIRSFQPYEHFQGSSDTAKLVEIALLVIQYFRANHIQNVKQAIESLAIVEDDDPDLLYLRKLGPSVPDDSCLSSFAKNFEKLHILFRDLKAPHFQLLEEIAKGQCDSMLAFFATDYHSEDGRKEFQTKVDHLNMRLQRDPFSNKVIMSLFDTHQMLSPFFPKTPKRRLCDVLQLLSGIHVDLGNIRTSNGQSAYISDMFKKAIASTTETTIEQLQQLSKKGDVNVELCLMTCSKSSFCFSYSLIEESSLSPFPNEDDRSPAGQPSVLKQQDVKDFRSNLQYLRSLQGDDELAAGAEASEVGRLANEFADLLLVVDELIDILFRLEREGHPLYQNRSISFKMEKTPLEANVQTLQKKLDQWMDKLEDSRKKCKILRLFTNQDVATILALICSDNIDVGLGHSVVSGQLREAAIKKLADVGDLSQETEETILVITGMLVDNYIRSVAAVAPVRHDIDLADRIQSILKETHTGHGRLLQAFQDLLMNCLVAPEERSQCEESHQYICSAKSAKSSLSDALMLLCTIYLHKCKKLPSPAQILFCSERTTKTELEVFFKRISTFQQLVFAMVGVELLGYNERSFLLEQQCTFHTEKNHGTVYYICLDHTICSWWPQSYVTNLQLEKQPLYVLTSCLATLLGSDSRRPKITVVVGKAGCGKTHYISREQRAAEDDQVNPVTVSIANALDTSSIVRKLAVLRMNSTVFFNLSSHVDVEDINRIFFELVVCGTLADPKYSALFTFPRHASSRWLIEIPYLDTQPSQQVDNSNSQQSQLRRQQSHQPGSSNDNPKQLAESQFPMVCLMSDFHVVNNDNNLVEITEKERKVCAILQAYRDGELDPKRSSRTSDTDEAWSITTENVTDDDMCRAILLQQFDDVLSSRASKMHQMAFLRYLYDRLKLFDQEVFRWSVMETYVNLAEKAVQHFLTEATYLSSRGLKCIWQACNQYFLIADPTGGSFATLVPPRRSPAGHSDPVQSTMLRVLYSETRDPLLAVKPDMDAQPQKYLQWAFGMSLATIDLLLNQKQFVLTKDFTYKLLLIHERKKARLPLIIEGETGVGKTFLLEMYTNFMNHEAAYSRALEHSPRLKSRFCFWVRQLVLHDLWPNLGSDARTWFAGNSTDSYPTMTGQVTVQQERLLATEEFDTPWSLADFWQTLLKNHLNDETKRIALDSLLKQVNSWIYAYPLLRPSERAKALAASTTISCEESEELIAEFISSPLEDLFYKKLVHPDITKQQLKDFMQKPISLACDCPEQEVVVFFDEVNTSSCLGVFKEMLMDRMLDGQKLQDNIFFISAINPSLSPSSSGDSVALAVTHGQSPTTTGQNANASLIEAYRQIYNVHELPPVMNQLKWIYGSLSTEQELEEYIESKISMQKNLIVKTDNCVVEFSTDMKALFASMLLRAHQYCLEYLGKSSVSQRDIQRVFLLVPFFWHVEESLIKERQSSGVHDSVMDVTKVLKKSIFLAIAVVYFFRLPVKPIVKEGSPLHGVCRQEFQHFLHQTGPAGPRGQEAWRNCSKCSSASYDGAYNFLPSVTTMIDDFVTRDHFSLPENVALTTALKENIFCTVACIQTRIPLGIVGQPGSSKTLSFHIVRDNLSGEHSMRPFCKQFVAIDSFFYQCSEQSTSAQIAAVFDAAIERQTFYNRQSQQGIEERRRRHVRFEGNQPVEEIIVESGVHQAKAATHCVVFLDEAGLPVEEKGKMVLKVLHPYLDDRKVAFVALSNHWFDSANANRMVTLFRSQAGLEDLITLAKGCVKRGGEAARERVASRTELNYITGLCEGYLKVTSDEVFAKLFHHRDLIYLLRHHYRQQQLENTQHISRNPAFLLSTLEENFGGVEEKDFKRLADMFFKAVHGQVQGDFQNFPSSVSGEERLHCRDAVQVLKDLKEQAKLAARSEILRTGSLWAPRFRMIIDPTEDYTSLDIMQQMQILDPDNTHIFHMSNLSGDQDELHSAEVLAKIRRLLETECTIVLVNTGRIHGSLYELLNQTFRVIHSDGGKHIYANIAVGATTYPCRVNPKFQCVVILKQSDAEKAPTPFLSRFSKLLLQPSDAVDYMLKHMEPSHADHALQVRNRCQAFIDHMGARNFYGCNQEFSGDCLLASHLHPTVGNNYKLVPFTTTTGEVQETFKASINDEVQLSIRGLCARLLQLMPTEHFVLKLKSLSQPSSYLTIYFDLLEHFSLQSIINIIRKNTSATGTRTSPVVKGIVDVHKFMIYTRSSLAISLISGKPSEYFGSEAAQNLEIVDTSTFHKSSEAEVFLAKFVESGKTCAVLLVDVSNGTSSVKCVALFKHIVNQVSAKAQAEGKGGNQSFVLLLHSPLYLPSSKKTYPSSFLQGWDCCFLDLPGGTDMPLINVKALAKSCAVQGLLRQQEVDENEGTSVQTQDMAQWADSLQQGLVSIKAELARVFCSRVSQVSCVEARVRELQPTKLIPFYTPTTLSEETVLEKVTVSDRVQSLLYVLDKYPAILKQVGRRLFKRFTPERSFELLDRLAKSVVQRESFFSFADLVEMHMRPELENIFQKFMLALSRDYGLVTLLASGLPDGITSQLFCLVPRMTVQDERSFVQQVCPLRCDSRSFKTPLFTHLKRRMDKIVKDTDMEADQSCEYIHSQVKSDEVLSLLITDPNLLDMYIHDLVRYFCNWTGSNATVENTRNFLWLKFTMMQERFPECDRLSHVHFCLHFDHVEITMVLYASGALEQLLDVDGLEKEVGFIKEEATDTEEFLQKLAKALFHELIKHLNELVRKIGTPEWSVCLKKWRQSYKFITEFFKPANSVNNDDLGDLNEALREIYAQQAGVMRLLVTSDIFFGSYNLVKEEASVKTFLDLISRLHSSRNFSPLHTVRTIIEGLKGKCEDKDLTILFLEYVKWLLDSSSTCREGEILTFVVHAVNTVGSDCFALPLHAATQVFDMVADKLLEHAPGNTPANKLASMLLTLERVVSSELLKDVSADNLAAAWPAGVYLPALYRPKDFPQDATNSLPDVVKQVLSSQLVDIFFEFRCRLQMERKTNEVELSEFVSEANTSTNVLTPGQLTPAIVIRFAAYVRAAFQIAAKEITVLASASSQHGEDDIDITQVQKLQRSLQDLFDQHSSQCKLWLPFFVSRLLSGSSSTSLKKVLCKFQGAWVQECVLKIDSTAILSQSSFAFTQAGTQAREADTLDGAYSSYEEFSTLFDQSVAENNHFQRIKDWYSQHTQSGAPVLIPKINSKCCADMYVFLKVYHGYFEAGRVSDVKSLFPELRSSPLLNSALGLLFNGCSCKVTGLKTIFTEGRCAIPELQYAREILIHYLAYLLASNEINTHLSTFVHEPMKLHRTLLFGAVNYRGYIDPDPEGVRVDCCNQFDHDGTPSYLSSSSQALPVALTPLGTHLNGLLIFTGLCLHGLLKPDTAGDTLEEVLTLSDVEAECGREDGFLAQSLQFCLNRIVQLHYHLYHDDPRFNPDCTLGLIISSFECMLKLQSTNRIAVLQSTYPIGAQNCVRIRQNAEGFYQKEVVDVVHQRTCVRLQRSTSSEDDVTPFMILQRPELKMKDVCSTLARLQSSGSACHPVLNGILERISPFQSLHYAIHIATFYRLLHRYLAFHLSEAEARNLSFPEAIKKVSNHRHRHRLQHFFKIALDSFNEFHKIVGGTLQPGACDTRVKYVALVPDNPLMYMISASDDEGDILLKVMEEILRHQEKFLDVCQEAKEQSECQSLRYTLTASQFEMRVPMHQVASQNGAGLLHLPCREVERLCLTHGRSFKDDDNVWQCDFDLEAIEQSAIHQYVNCAHHIDLKSLREPFCFKESIDYGILHIQELSKLLPRNYFGEKIDAGSKDVVDQELKRQHYQESLKTLQCLVFVSNDITSNEQLMRNPNVQDIDTIRQETLHSYIRRQKLASQWPSLTAMCHQTEVKLQHIIDLYDVIKNHLLGHEYLYMRIPHLLKQDMTEELEKIVDEYLESFFKRLKAGEALKAIDCADEAIGVLQDSVPGVQNQSDDSLSATLVDMLGVADDKDEDDILGRLPELVRGHHLKSVMAKLVKHGCEARKRHVDHMEECAPWEETVDRVEDKPAWLFQRSVPEENHWFDDDEEEYDEVSLPSLEASMVNDEVDEPAEVVPLDDMTSVDSDYDIVSNEEIQSMLPNQDVLPPGQVNISDETSDSDSSDGEFEEIGETAAGTQMPLNAYSPAQTLSPTPRARRPPPTEPHSPSQQRLRASVSEPEDQPGSPVFLPENSSQVQTGVSRGDAGHMTSGSISHQPPLPRTLARRNPPPADDDDDVNSQVKFDIQKAVASERDRDIDSSSDSSDGDDNEDVSSDEDSDELHNDPDICVDTSQQLNTHAMTSSQWPQFTISTSSYTMCLPAATVTKAAKGMCRRSITLLGSEDTEVKPISFLATRAKVLQKAADSFAEVRETLTLTDEHGYVLNDDEDVVQQSGKLCVYYAAKLNDTVRVTFKQPTSGATTNGDSSVSCSFKRSVSVQSLCSTALRLFCFESLGRAELCTERGIVLHQDLLATMLDSGEALTFTLHTGNGMLVNCRGLMVPPMSVVESGWLSEITGLVTPGTSVWPALESVTLGAETEVSLWLVPETLFCDLTVTCGGRQLRVNVARCLSIDKLHRCLDDKFDIDDASVLISTSSSGVVRIIPDTAKLYQYTVACLDGSRCYLHLLAPKKPFTVEVDVSVFEMVKTKFEIDVYGRNAGNVVQELAQKLKVTPEVEAMSYLLDMSTLCEIPEDVELAGYYSALAQPALQLLLQTRDAMFNIVVLEKGHEKKAVSLVASASCTAEHLLANLQAQPEFMLLSQQPDPMQVLTMDGVWLPPNARLAPYCEFDRIAIQIGVCSPSECCYFTVANPAEHEPSSWLVAVETSACISALLTFALGQVTTSEVSRYQMVIENAVTLSASGSMDKTVQEICKDLPSADVDTVHGSPEHPWNCQLVLNLGVATGNSTCARDLQQITVALVSEPDVTQQLSFPASMSIRDCYRTMCIGIGLDPSLQPKLLVESRDSGQSEPIEFDDEEDPEDALPLADVLEMYSETFFIDAPEGTTMTRSVLPQASVELGASWVEVPATDVDKESEPPTEATVDIQVQLKGQEATRQTATVLSSATFGDLIEAAKALLAPGMECILLLVDGDEMEVEEEELSCLVSDILDGVQIMEFQFKSDN